MSGKQVKREIGVILDVFHGFGKSKSYSDKNQREKSKKFEASVLFTCDKLIFTRPKMGSLWRKNG